MTPLKAGDIAPKFSLPDRDGEEVNLTDFRGQRVWFIFTEAMTPGCTVRACGLRDNMDDLKKPALKCWASAPINRKNSPVSPKRAAELYAAV